MKQTTLFDFKLKSSNPLKYQPDNPLQKISNTVVQKDDLIKTYIQKSLSEIIKEQEELQRIKDLLGNSWFKQENGYGFTDKNNVMVLSTLQEFNKNFFNLYKFEDFEQLIKKTFKLGDIREDKDSYLKLNGIEYNSYYLFKSFKVLGEKFEIYQHSKLKLLFLRNSKYAAVICPKF